MNNRGQEDRGNGSLDESTAPERPAENPLIARHLSLLRTELTSHPQETDAVAVQLAQMLSPSYVNDATFLQSFLLADKLDVKRAAHRVRKHFAKKMQLFGLEGLGGSVSTGNLLPNDLASYSSGGMLIVPEKDAEGRNIFVLRYGMIKFSEHRDMLRALWAMLMSAVTSGQMSSNIVWISVDDDVNDRLDRSILSSIAPCISCLPLRIADLHSLVRQESNSSDALIESLMKNYDIEAQYHVGAPTHWIYSLASSGIASQFLASSLLLNTASQDPPLGMGSQQGSKRKMNSNSERSDAQEAAKLQRIDDNLLQLLSPSQQQLGSGNGAIASSTAASAVAAAAASASSVDGSDNASSMQSGAASQASASSSFVQVSNEAQQQQSQNNPQEKIMSLLRSLAAVASPPSQEMVGNIRIPSVAAAIDSQLFRDDRYSSPQPDQQLELIKNQLQSLLGGITSGAHNTSMGSLSVSVPTASSLQSALNDPLNLIAGILSGPQAKNLEAAILGAQMFINNPEAAAQVLLGSSGAYTQLQGIQQNAFDTAREDNFASSQRILSEQRGQLEAGAAAQHLQPLSAGMDAAAVDGPLANTAYSSHSGASTAQKQAMESAAASIPGKVSGPGGTRPAILLYTPSDDTTLSRYQCLVRQQIEMFEATEDDVQFNISRMSKIIVLGQVGIRCRHCAVLPQYSRPKAAVYYPRTLDSMYQFGQNMVKNHLCACCELIPSETKNLLIALQEARKRGRGGRDRWAQAAHEMGVVEDENGLRFK